MRDFSSNFASLAFFSICKNSSNFKLNVRKCHFRRVITVSQKDNSMNYFEQYHCQEQVYSWSTVLNCSFLSWLLACPLLDVNFLQEILGTD
jgi:hypothetical protein